jgi:hypothetical protein
VERGLEKPRPPRADLCGVAHTHLHVDVGIAQTKGVGGDCAEVCDGLFSSAVCTICGKRTREHDNAEDGM